MLCCNSYVTWCSFRSIHIIYDILHSLYLYMYACLFMSVLYRRILHVDILNKQFKRNVNTDFLLFYKQFVVYFSMNRMSWILQHIGAEIKWPLFSRRYFKCIFWKKMFECRLRLHWSLIVRVKSTIPQHRFWQWRRSGDKPLSEALMS